MTISEIRERVVAHIEVVEAIVRKNNNSYVRQPGSKESAPTCPLGVNKISANKRTNWRYVPYVTKRDEPKTKGREELDNWPRFRVF